MAANPRTSASGNSRARKSTLATRTQDLPKKSVGLPPSILGPLVTLRTAGTAYIHAYIRAITVTLRVTGVGARALGLTFALEIKQLALATQAETATPPRPHVRKALGSLLAWPAIRPVTAEPATAELTACEPPLCDWRPEPGADPSGEDLGPPLQIRFTSQKRTSSR